MSAAAQHLDDTTARVVLTALDGCGPRRAAALVAAHGSPAAGLAAIRAGKVRADLGPVRGGAEALLATWRTALAGFDVDALVARQRRVGEIVPPADPRWPSRLVSDPEPPMVLFGAGTPPAAAPRHVAIVGTRRCTALGRAVAGELGAALAGAGHVVVSGLARGIDAAAHQGALAVGGAVVAVVATGLDVVYPARNATLWHQVADHGVIWTEAGAGTGPERWRFPARNRILAGLADVVVVVESDRRGGSMHTVQAAIDRQVEVLAVPGPVRSPTSAGTNALIVEGCTPICDPDDLLAAVESVPRRGGADWPAPAAPRLRRLPSVGPSREPPHLSETGVRGLDPEAQRVLAALGPVPTSGDALADLIDRTAAELASPLVTLELAGYVQRVDGGYVRRPR